MARSLGLPYSPLDWTVVDAERIMANMQAKQYAVPMGAEDDDDFPFTTDGCGGSPSRDQAKSDVEDAVEDFSLIDTLGIFHEVLKEKIERDGKLLKRALDTYFK